MTRMLPVFIDGRASVLYIVHSLLNFHLQREGLLLPERLYTIVLGEEVNQSIFNIHFILWFPRAINIDIETQFVQP